MFQKKCFKFEIWKTCGQTLSKQMFQSGNIMIYFNLSVLFTKESFQVFKSNWLDKFLAQFIEKDKILSDLWIVCIFFFVLDHGQSETERWFNINKTMLVENLEETSIKGHTTLWLYDSKISLLTNLLLPNNLHYPASLHTVNIRLLWKVPEQKL